MYIWPTAQGAGAADLPVEPPTKLDLSISRAMAVLRRPQLSGATGNRNGGPTMSLIGNGYALSTRRALLGTLFSALVALVLLDLGAAGAPQPAPQAPPQPQAIYQIKLTEKQVQGYIVTAPEIENIYNGADPNKPDPKLDAQALAIVKKNGFANFEEYDDVAANIGVIFDGIDPQTKQFTEPPDQIKKDIEAVKADKTIKDADRKQQLADLAAMLKVAKPIQFKENIDLVLKYYDKLAPLMQQRQG
jgi:hypothetical protein